MVSRYIKCVLATLGRYRRKIETLNARRQQKNVVESRYDTTFVDVDGTETSFV